MKTKPKSKQYKRDRIIHILENLGFKVLNRDSDAPVYFLHHPVTDKILSIDKYPDKFPEDYVREKINPEVMDFALFTYLYEQSKKEK